MNCESCGHENLDDARFCASCGLQMAQSEGDSWVGRLVGGRFKVTHVLGEGGMGVVYAAEQQMGSTVRKAAIKTLHPHLSQDPSVLARFHRECGTVAQLEHPNTIKVFDFGDQDGTLYIAMEFVQGLSLDKIIESDSPLSPARVVDILDQVCGALDEAHDQGIVHRDLKPENVILGEKLGKADFVKVLDFGIAARTESADTQKEQKLTQQGMVLGTPPYMSPEQFTGAELDRRSDVYSLGVMAYEMLTGRLPFTANTPWQWATEHMTAQPFPIEQVPSGAGIPHGMRDAVMQALAKEPEERPATAGDLLANLRRGLSAAANVATDATAAMQAVPPNFSGAPGGSDSTLAMPATETAPAASAHPVETAGGMSATQPINVPKKSGGGVLFAGLGALLVGGAALAFFLTSGPSELPVEDEEDPESAAAQAAEGDEPSAETPEPAATAEPTAEPSPEPTATAKPTSSPQPTASPKPTASPQPTAKPSATSRPPVQPTATATATASPPPPKLDCSQCVPSVRSGNWSKAVQLYRSCDATTQGKCRIEGKRQALSQVKAAVAAGQCSRAKSIASSAAQMSAKSGRVDTEIAKCQ